MSDKPSLYVVEKKEVVVLVVLFVLVTVLAFTMGVKYGESLGQQEKAVKEEYAAEIGAETPAGGKLGAAEEKAHDTHKEASAEAPKGGEHSKPAEEKPAPMTEGEVASAQVAAEKNSDEALLDALKSEGVEPPGGKAPGGAELPSEVKMAKVGTYVIQVGSHPTRFEAESQLKSLRAKELSAEILNPFKDKQGEWHRVVIGGFKNKRDADREALALKNKGLILSYFVWRMR